MIDEMNLIMTDEIFYFIIVQTNHFRKNLNNYCFSALYGNEHLAHTLPLVFQRLAKERDSFYGEYY